VFYFSGWPVHRRTLCVQMSEDLSATALRISDPLLKDVDFTKFYQLASEDSVAKTKKALEGKGHAVTVVADRSAALETVKSLIPPSVSVMNGGSTTLKEIGFMDFLKTATAFKNLHATVFAETDPVKQADIRRKALGADVFISSVPAIAETGEIVVCDFSSTRVGGFTAAGKTIIVVGSNKITSNYDEALRRTSQFALPMESARVRVAYKRPSSAINFSLTIAGSITPSRFHVVIVKEVLGY